MTPESKEGTRMTQRSSHEVWGNPQVGDEIHRGRRVRIVRELGEDGSLLLDNYHLQPPNISVTHGAHRCTPDKWREYRREGWYATGGGA